MMPKYDGKIYAELKKIPTEIRNIYHGQHCAMRQLVFIRSAVYRTKMRQSKFVPPEKKVKIERATLKIDALNRNNRKIVLENH